MTNETQDVQETKPEISDDAPSAVMTYAIQIVAVVMIVLSIIIPYHFLVVEKKSQKIGLLDIAEVIGIKQLIIADKATQPDVTDQDREAIFESITAFSKEMEAAVTQIQQECGCTLLVRGAVVKTAKAEDLTPVLKERLGLSKSMAELTASIRTNPGTGLGEKPGLAKPSMPSEAAQQR